MKLNKEYSIQELSKKYNCATSVKDTVRVDCLCSINNMKKNGLSYILNNNLLSKIENPSLAAIITTKEISQLISVPCIITDEPLYIFSKIINDCIDSKYSGLLEQQRVENNSISSSAKIGKNVVIGKGVHIGKNTIIYPNVVINDYTFIGDDVIIHPNAIIGSDGFGLVMHEKKWEKVTQIGNVIIESGVEIGSNTTIDKAAIDSTIIKSNVKIDNQVHIAHNVIIGENTAIAACVGIAGSTVIGKNCTIGGGAGLNGHITIADNVHINGMAMVTSSIEEPGQYASGTTIEPASSWRKNQARFKKLDELAKLIKKNKNGENNE